MKRVMTILLAAAVVAASAWCEAAETARKRRPRGRPSGGLVTKEYRGRRILVAADAAAMPDGVAEEALETMRRTSRLPVFAADMEAQGKFTTGESGGSVVLAHTEDAEAQREAKSEGVRGKKTMGWDEAVATAKGLIRDGAAAVVVVADGGCPAALVAAPEEGWAVIDAAVVAGRPLCRGDEMSSHTAADAQERVPPMSASESAVRGRMAKELWRGVAYALGVGAAQSCVTGVARTPKGLDLLPPSPSPDTLNRMMDAAAARGAGLLSFASYRTACEEGWAPSPANDVQRAVWNEVRLERERRAAKAAGIAQ